MPDPAQTAAEHMQKLRQLDPPRAAGAPVPQVPPAAEVERELARIDGLIGTCTLGERGSVRVVYVFRGSGELVRATVRATGLDADDRQCIQRHAGLARLRPFRAAQHQVTRARTFAPSRIEDAVPTGIAACDEWARVACACADPTWRNRLCTMAVESNARLSPLVPHLRPSGVTFEEQLCRQMADTNRMMCAALAGGSGQPAAPPGPPPAPAPGAPTGPAVGSVGSLDMATPELMACAAGRWGTARISVTTETATGRVVEAQVRSDPFAGTPAGACMEAALRTVTVPASPGSTRPRSTVVRSFDWTPTNGPAATFPPPPAWVEEHSAATNAINAAMDTCSTTEALSGTVRIDFDASGNVSQVAVTAGSLVGTPMAACLVRAVRSASIPRFPVQILVGERSMWIYPSYPRRPPAPFRSGIAVCDEYVSRSCSCPDLAMRGVSCPGSRALVGAWRARQSPAQVERSCTDLLGVVRQRCGPAP